MQLSKETRAIMISSPIFFLTNMYKELKNYYTKYKEEASNFKDSDLNEVDKMSKDVLLWECNINLETLTFKKRNLFSHRPNVVGKPNDGTTSKAAVVHNRLKLWKISIIG